MCEVNRSENGHVRLEMDRERRYTVVLLNGPLVQSIPCFNYDGALAIFTAVKDHAII